MNSILDKALTFGLDSGPASTDLLVPAFSSIVPYDHMPGSYLDLVAAVIRSGLKHEGLEYLRTDGGQYWCVMGNLDPEAVRKLALQYRLSRERSPLAEEDPEQAEAPQTW